MKARICATLAVLIALISLAIKQALWESLSEQAQNTTDVQIKAWFADMTDEEFELLSSVVEAESDRSENLEGKKLIALTILNRVESSNHPNSIKAVITESGQFQVYAEGTYRKVGRTDSSDRAVIEAVYWQQDEHPNVIYFNCIGYNHLGTPYCYEGGNYFETE